MKSKIIILLIIVGCIIGGIIYLRSRQGNNKEFTYQTAVVERGDIRSIVITTGTIEPITIVEVGSQVSGIISKIYVDYNSLVKKGQVIAEIDKSLFLTRIKQNEANYNSALAELEKAKVQRINAEKSYKRAIELFEKSLISVDEKDKVEAAYNIAVADVLSAEARVKQSKAQLDSAKVDLEHTIITSPVDGIVISRDVNVGQTVAASFQAPVLFRIAEDLTQMYVTCHVDEADIGKVKEEQKAEFTVDAYPDDKFVGIVKQVRYSPQTIQNVVTYDAIVVANNDELKLRPGMTATVSIITDYKKDVLKVPVGAINFHPPSELQVKIKEMMANKSIEKSTDSFKHPAERIKDKSKISFIWLVDKNKQLTPVPVITGVSDSNFIEIVRVLQKELKEGQAIAIASESEQMRRPGMPPFRMMMR
jgi:HlyD family secretion protein